MPFPRATRKRQVTGKKIKSGVTKKKSYSVTIPGAKFIPALGRGGGVSPFGAMFQSERERSAISGLGEGAKKQAAGELEFGPPISGLGERAKKQAAGELEGGTTLGGQVATPLSAQQGPYPAGTILPSEKPGQQTLRTLGEQQRRAAEYAASPEGIRAKQVSDFEARFAAGRAGYGLTRTGGPGTAGGYIPSAQAAGGAGPQAGAGAQYPTGTAASGAFPAGLPQQTLEALGIQEAQQNAFLQAQATALAGASQHLGTMVERITGDPTLQAANQAFLKALSSPGEVTPEALTAIRDQINESLSAAGIAEGERVRQLASATGAWANIEERLQGVRESTKEAERRYAQMEYLNLLNREQANRIQLLAQARGLLDPIVQAYQMGYGGTAEMVWGQTYPTLDYLGLGAAGEATRELLDWYLSGL